MTKREIYEGTLKRRMLLAPCSDVSDIAHDEQLKAREYFVEIDDDMLGRKLTMPGAFAKFSVTPVGPHHRAPRVGEHNSEIYGGLLGVSESRLQSLRSAGGI
jgi:crotonobetainyl-CoA:carnitine CoA-transferase CaiB-like acyl-CoA transferase